MKNLYIAIIMLLMTQPLVAQQNSKILFDRDSIQNQIQEAKNLIDKVGRDKISDVYFQKLEEFHAQLTQIKASPDTTSDSLFEVNGLYDNIEGILNPEKPLNNHDGKSIIESNDKGENNGYIRGFIYDSNGDVVNEGRVRLYNNSGTYAGFAYVDNAGRYILNDVSPGEYVIVFSPNYNSDLIDTAYPSKACPNGIGHGCQVADLYTVTLNSDTNLENINILALRLPTISGQVTDSQGDSLSYVRVSLYDSQTNYIRYVRTDSDGMYTVATTEQGEFYLTFSHSDFQLELYNNIICIQECNIGSGTAIALNFDQNIQNINASLVKNATISGSVIEVGTAIPIVNSQVHIVDISGSVVEQINLSSTHLWETDIQAGNYFIIGSDRDNYDNYLATKYPNNTCYTSQVGSCENIDGTLIPHTLTDSTNIALKRTKGARINGLITGLNNEPVSGVRLKVFYVLNLNNTWNSNSIYTDEFGQFSTHQLGNNGYYVVAEKNSHLVQLYYNKNCNSVSECDFGSGTVVSINNLNDVNDIDFQLTPKSTMSGSVVDQNNNPLIGIQVTLNGGANNHYYSDYTNNNGEYYIQNISAGSNYKLIAKGGSNSQGSLYSEVYNNIQCDDYNCYNENYTPIEVNTNQDLTIDFELTYKGQVNFDLISNSANAVNSGYISVVDIQGNKVGTYDINSSVSLPNGDYYFYYSGSNYYNDYAFVSKVYGGTNCTTTCDATTGTLVRVSDNSEQSLSMNLDQYFYLEVTSSPDNMYLELYEEDLSYYSGRRISGLERFNIYNMDKKYVKVNGTGYYSQLYPAVYCENTNCNISLGNLIVPVLNSSLSIDFNLSPLTSLSGIITDQNNNPLADKRVRLLSELNSYSGRHAITNSNGEYTFDAIVPGDYYLRVDSDDDYYSYGEHTTTYYGNISCDLDDCSGLGINPLTINISDYLTGVNIKMSNRGSMSGEGIKNTLDEISPAQIYFYRVTGDSFIDMADVYVENGILPSIYLPEGEYKLVARFNNQGIYTSYPSNLCRLGSLQLCAEMSESLHVTNGSNTHFSSFILHQYGILNVKVMNAIDNTSIENAKVDLYKSNGSFIRTYYADGNNDVNINITTDGLYKLFIHESDYSGESKYIAQLYNGIDCQDGLGFDCLFTQGQDISVEMDSVLTITANLKPKPRLKIDVLNAITNNQIANTKINIFDSFGHKVLSEYYPNLGESHYIDTLQVGNYYAIIRLDNENTATAYPNVFCGNYEDLGSCDTGLTAFSLQLGDDPKQINIRATPLSAIHGYVFDITTDQPLENVIIDYWNSYGNYIGSEVSATNGGFSKTLSNGEYYVSTDTNSTYINEVYKNIQCQNAAILGECDITRGELINITSNNSSPLLIDIELAKDPIFADGFD